MLKNKGFLNWLRVLWPWLVVFITLAFLISNRHSKTKTFNWTTPLWADQAGYYVYLPSLFVYHFDANSFPEKIDEKTGNGFMFDLNENKVITRYTCGVAILQAPFFIFIHILAGILELPQDGFSDIYHQIPNLAALFYCVIGLFFLWKFLITYYSKGIVVLTLITLFLGSNLYYYAVDSTGMSHIYSFFVFALILWITKKILSDDIKYRKVYFSIWSLLFALIVLIRPTNILIFPFLFCLDCNSIKELRQRFRKFLTIPNIAILLISFLVIFLPQLIYWKYMSGNYITYSYSGYGFTNWGSPKIPELWFSPNNGLFLYSPFYLVVIYGLFQMVNDKKLMGLLILVTFLLISYVFASWFIFSFGCGFGSRNFVEYVALFTLPVGYFFSRIQRFSLTRKVTIIIIVTFLVVFNVRLVYSYNRCFQGGDWDFKEYVSYLVEFTKYHESLDFEEPDYLNNDKEYSKTIYLPAEKIEHVRYKKAVVKAKVTLETSNSEASVVLAIETPDSTIYWNGGLLREQIPNNRLNRKRKVKYDFWIPATIPRNSTIATYIWNKNKERLILHDLDLYLVE